MYNMWLQNTIYRIKYIISYRGSFWDQFKVPSVLIAICSLNAGSAPLADPGSFNKKIFKCRSGQLIFNKFVLDGDPDCLDRTDEGNLINYSIYFIKQVVLEVQKENTTNKNKHAKLQMEKCST